MIKYEDVLKDPYINEIFDKISIIENTDIDDKNKQFWWVHGREHALAVVAYMEQVMSYIECSEEEMNLGKITGFLHDLGCIEFKEGHALRSAEMVKEYLQGKDMSKKDKETILSAILDHGKGLNISGKIDAALLIADKINVDKSRILEEGKRHEESRQFVFVDEVNLAFENNTLIVNMVSSDEILLQEFKEYYFTIKMVEVIHKACI